MARMKLTELLDRLTDEIKGATRLPLTSRVLVDPETLLDLIDGIRLELPDEIKKAERMLREREAGGALGSSGNAQVIGLAEQEAQRIVEEARSFALKVREESEQYARDVLSSLAATLDKALKVVRRGEEELGSSRRDKAPH